MVGSDTRVPESFFNKSASLMTWKPITLLGRDSSTGVFLWVLRNCDERFFAEHLLATTSDMTLFSFFFADKWGLQPKNNLFGGEVAN